MAYQSPQGLASLGRNGDSMLVHMSPSEVAGLQGLAMAQGGSLTINPETGLPEAFSLGGFFKGLLPMFAGVATGGAGAPLWAGIAAGAATGALTNKNRLMGALTGGLGGYGGFGIGKSLFSAGAPSLSAGAAGGGSSGLATGGGYIPNATSAADLAYNSAMMGPTAGTVNTGLSNVGTSMMTDPSILNARNAAQAVTTGGGGSGSILANSAASPAEQALSQYGSNLSQSLKGASNIFSGDQAAIDAYTKSIGAKTAMGALGKTALPVAGAALGGVEESDIYGKPINIAAAKEDESYDPYRSLTLTGDTGLRLVAKGGEIKSYAVGGNVGNPSVGGGLSDLYNRPEGQTLENISNDGYGIGRLNTLAQQESLNNAKTLGYAMGGPVSFADGGDSNKLTDDNELIDKNLGLTGLSLTTPAVNTTPAGTLTNAVNAASTAGSSDAGVVAQVTNAVKNDPSYQPKNPIEEAIVKQLKGGDMNQSSQGIATLGAKPSAPNFNPSVAMGPTYYAGLNAPRGYARGGYLDGAGDGMSDSIPATIEGKQPARLADGEFVVSADVVSHLGNGSTKAGAKKLYKMMDKVRLARTGNKKQGKQINADKYLPR